ncbi:dipeptide ABC transporter ATP-binding protein [Luteimicrobium xylanilyticum]|nr:ABC transporter ATP-binding protein [Luteimicrobium xylanilyticum]
MTTTKSDPARAGADDAPAVVSIRDLSVSFATDDGAVEAVRDVSLEVRQGEILAVVGESGSGKTVTARSVLRLLPENATTRGAVVLRSRDRERAYDVASLDHAGLRQARGTDVAMVFQEPSAVLNPVYPVGWQIEEGLRAHRRLSRTERRAAAVDVLRRVGIPEPEVRVDHYPHQFSGGQKQRIVIAMALALDPGLIVADEPTTALDVTVQAEILDLLRRCRDEFGASVLLITHNMGVVADLADRVVVMHDGRVVEQAPVRDLFRSPREEYTRELLAAVPSLEPVTSARPGAPAATPVPNSRHRPQGSQAQGQPAIEARELVVTYPGRLGRPGATAVDHVDLTLAPGEVLGLVGESGSGKTTIGRAIAGLTPATGGSLRVLGTEVRGARGRALRAVRPRIGFVFQDPGTSFNPLLTVGDGVAEPLVVHGRAANPAAARDRVVELLESVHLTAEHARRYPHELSGGQRQRASLARALALEPDLVIADEPTSALDVSVQARVLELFADLHARLGFACLFISHDLAVVDQVADRIAVLHRGRVVEEGSPATVLRRPEDPYTQRLVASVPVPDPVEQARRRTERLAARG